MLAEASVLDVVGDDSLGRGVSIQSQLSPGGSGDRIDCGRRGRFGLAAGRPPGAASAIRFGGAQQVIDGNATATCVEL